MRRENVCVSLEEDGKELPSTIHTPLNMSMILTYYIPRFDIYDVLQFTDLENDRVFHLVDRIFERHERLFSDNNIDHGTLVLSKVSHPRWS